MMNIGIIGDIQLMEPYINLIRERSDVQIVGKSSVGTNTRPDKFRFTTIPEFNRVELIDRSDALLINNFSILRFSVLGEIIKKSKHIFTATYPDLSIEECSHLGKLANEAKTLFQFTNPLLYLPAVQWLKQNISFPAYIDVSYFNQNTENDLRKLLSMLKGITGIVSKKVNASWYTNPRFRSEFKNIRFQLGDATVVNLNCGMLDSSGEFIIKSYAENQFVSFNFNTETFACNNHPVNLKAFAPLSELAVFIETVKGKKNKVTDIDDYLAICESFEEINEKLSQFSGR